MSNINFVDIQHLKKGEVNLGVSAPRPFHLSSWVLADSPDLHHGRQV